MIYDIHRRKYITGYFHISIYHLLNYLTFLISNYPKSAGIRSWEASWLRKIRVGKGKIEIWYVGYEKVLPQNYMVTFEFKVSDLGYKVVYFRAPDIKDARIFLNFLERQLGLPSDKWQLTIDNMLISNTQVEAKSLSNQVDTHNNIAWVLSDSLRKNPNYFITIVKSKAISKVERIILMELWNYRDIDFPLFEHDILRIIGRHLGSEREGAEQMLNEIKNKFLKREWIKVVKT